uniref:Uncharacterized protein n=1 Tax=Anguilla anguilla TaxID=7936 RepID=A0A0E9XZH8_ANGAN
MRPEEKNKPGT